ncbi:MAG TPA: 16S rRNA (guanine(527)-N(7))-methyltransferase RsmG [Oscillospiraceae bacterium]|nr:16S rRNA (guanine(527)-N(7))-methyltransferase RsmG [Oscillospiraceae bacterium]HNW04747.1 16S rRNA (guanine(527)-N(7))-methyltransferase RsmG [Oscillospiraceae bacterium]
MITEILRPLLPEYGLSLGEEQFAALEVYAAMLKEWNKKMNLTAITDDEGIAVKHFLDSLAVLRYADPPQEAKLADVGAGAGFPGAVLKIARPDLRLTLIDGLGKRVTFLAALSERLGFEAECLHLRAEEAGRDPALRERFDLVTARAVAGMNVLAEYCLPLVKRGGTFAAMKGPEPDAEIAAAEKAIRLLGGAKPKWACYRLPSGDGRTLVTVQKIAATPEAYPRCSAKIAKLPL